MIPKSIRVLSRLEVEKLALSLCEPDNKRAQSKLKTVNKKIEKLINPK